MNRLQLETGCELILNNSQIMKCSTHGRSRDKYPGIPETTFILYLSFFSGIKRSTSLIYLLRTVFGLFIRLSTVTKVIELPWFRK